MLEDVNRTVPIAGTYEFWLCCGANTQFDEEVSYVVLSAPGISSLDPVSWRVDIPH